MGKVSDQKIKQMDGKILCVMLRFHMEERFNAKVEDVADELGVHVRTSSFRNRWNIMKNKKNFIGPGEGRGLRLTSKGLEEAGMPEYKEMMKEISIHPKTNKEHQDRIKNYLKKPKSGVIFDFLLEYKRLNKTDLATLIGMHIRSRGFSDSVAELRAKNYIESDANGKFYLSNKCFLRGKGICSMESIDKGKLARELAAGSTRIKERKRGRESNEIKLSSIPHSSNKKPKKDMSANDAVKMKVMSVIPYTNIKSEY